MSHRIGIVVFDGITLLDASGPAEVFHHADPSGEHYDITYASPAGGTVVASSRMALAETIAAALSEQRDVIEEVIEPYLLQQGFIQRTPRGRLLTQSAYAHMGLEAPRALVEQLDLLGVESDGDGSAG